MCTFCPGILGQTFDRDNLAVHGKRDDYGTPIGYQDQDGYWSSASNGVIVTKAQGEGALEGLAQDYEIDPANPFSTKFKYSRFGLANQRVPPRDVSKLSGIKLPAKIGGGAGAVNDEPDA